VFETVLCKNCEQPVGASRYKTKPKMYCSKNCGVAWRTKHVYKYKYSVVSRGRSVENFLKALCVKKLDRRKLTVSFLKDLYDKQEGLCAVSGVPMTYVCGQGNVDTNISVDRINSGIGYEEDNIQLVCRRVNMMKMDKDIDDLLFWCKSIENFNPRNNSPANLRVVSKKTNRTKQPKRG